MKRRGYPVWLSLSVIVGKIIVMMIICNVFFSMQTEVIPSKDEIDPDVVHSMSSLGCFKNRERLLRNLLKQEYVLLNGCRRISWE